MEFSIFFLIFLAFGESADIIYTCMVHLSVLMLWETTGIVL